MCIGRGGGHGIVSSQANPTTTITETSVRTLT
jgi:hypothetical protein